MEHKRSGPKPLPPAELLFRHLTIDDTGKCWPWRGTVAKNGYGHFAYERNGKRWRGTAHRAAYEILVAQVPDDLVVDHDTCDNRVCCNPSHLKPVTQQVNILRGTSLSARRARQTHCLRGHEFTAENTGHENGRVHRRCRICRRTQRSGGDT